MHKFILFLICTSIYQIAFTQSERLEVEGAIVISDNEAQAPAAGTIRWTGQDFEGFDGTEWKSLTGYRQLNCSVLDYIPDTLHASIVDGTNTVDLSGYIQSALDASKSTCFPEGTYYITNTLYPQRKANITGAGKDATTIQAVGVSAFHFGDGVGSTERSISLHHMNVKGDTYPAVRIFHSPDFVIQNCHIQQGVYVTFAVRGIISDCRLGASGAGTWAVLTDDYVNGLKVMNNVVSGGTAGGAINLRGPNTNAQVTGNIIESSKFGIFVSSDPITGSSAGGASRSVRVSDNYIEQSEVPIFVGGQFRFNGIVKNNIIGNTETSVIPNRYSTIKMGRIYNSEIINNQIMNATNEVPIEIVMNAVESIQGNTISGNFIVNRQPINLLLSGTYATNGSLLAALGSRNYIDVDMQKSISNALYPEHMSSITPREYISPVFTANEATEITKWLDANKILYGGRLISAELIDVKGDLTGCSLQIGSAVSLSEIVSNIALDAIPLDKGQGALPAASYIRRTDDSVYRVNAGTGTGTFRFRLVYKIT